MPCARGAVVGVLSEADVLYKERGRIGTAEAAPSRGSSRTTPPRLARRPGARTVARRHDDPRRSRSAPARTAAGAARLMLEHGVNRLPVVAEAAG